MIYEYLYHLDARYRNELVQAQNNVLSCGGDTPQGYIDLLVAHVRLDTLKTIMRGIVQSADYYTK